MPGDELEMWRACKHGASAWGILRGEVPLSMHLPFPAYIKAFQQLFHLEPTLFAIRLPGALLGILCIPMLFAAGRRLLGVGGGLLAAALTAIHPVHIQCSMEAYPYVVAVLGMTLGLNVLLALARIVKTDSTPEVWHYMLFGFAVILLTFSSISSWQFAALLLAAAVVPFLFPLRDAWSVRRRPLLLIVAVGLLVVGWPFSKQVLLWLSQSSMKYGHAGYQSDIRLFDTEGLRFATNFAWGSTPMRAALSLVLAAGGLLALARRRTLAGGLTVGLIALGFLATMVARYPMGHPFTSRLLVTMMPAYHLLLSAGMLLPYEALCTRWPRWAGLWRLSLAIWLGVLLLPLVQPIRMAMTVRGTPFPYRETVAWADAQLPPGTPVLCERFFDAYNEFAVNAPTSAVFMCTIPNEPVQRFEQEHWRDTARDFLVRNPDAAFYETRMFWKQVGLWDWPHQHFARVQRFQDPNFTALYKLGLSYREIGNELSIDEIPRAIYYNTPDDLVARARAAGESVLAVYGAGWGYTKTTDYRDWRTLGDAATVTVYNLGDADREVSLQIEAVAVGGSRTISGPQSRRVTLPPNQPVRAELGPLRLAPGANVVRLASPSTAAGPQASVLVYRLTATAVPSAPGVAAPAP